MSHSQKRGQSSYGDRYAGIPKDDVPRTFSPVDEFSTEDSSVARALSNAGFRYRSLAGAYVFEVPTNQKDYIVFSTALDQCGVTSPPYPNSADGRAARLRRLNGTT